MKEQPTRWCYNEDRLTVKELTSKIGELKNKIDSIVVQEEIDQHIVNSMNRGIQHLMRVRADKMSAKSK
jgi:hypothetical protein